jgi:hypothetical protein
MSSCGNRDGTGEEADSFCVRIKRHQNTLIIDGFVIKLPSVAGAVWGRKQKFSQFFLGNVTFYGGSTKQQPRSPAEQTLWGGDSAVSQSKNGDY